MLCPPGGPPTFPNSSPSDESGVVATPHHCAADYRGYRTAMKCVTVKRRIAALREGTVHVVRPLTLGIKNRHVARRTRRERTAIELQYTGRSAGEQRHQPREADLARMHQFLERQPQRGLQPDDAERALLEFLHLLTARMRRVVGRNRVHHARGNALDYRSRIAFRSQR